MSVTGLVQREEVVESLDRDIAEIAAIKAHVLTRVARCDDEDLWRRDGATSMSAWLMARYGLAKSTAREWVRIAHALRELPKIAEAYAFGSLSWDQLRPLTKFATPETDERWAQRAPTWRPWSLHREADRHARMKRSQAEEVHQERSFVMSWDREAPFLCLEGRLAAEQGAAFERALLQHVEDVSRKDKIEGVSFEARMADALVELTTRTGEGLAQPATLVVHADAAVVAGREPNEGPVLAETEEGTRLATDTVRRMACDARVEWVLEEEGRPVGVGRQARAVPPHLVRLLRLRDRGCRFPGCERRRFANAHHLVHWANGGPTNLENLVLLCHAHHRLIHEGGWTTSGHPEKELRFHDPSGRPIRAGPSGRAA